MKYISYYHITRNYYKTSLNQEDCRIINHHVTFNHQVLNTSEGCIQNRHSSPVDQEPHGVT